MPWISLSVALILSELRNPESDSRVVPFHRFEGAREVFAIEQSFFRRRHLQYFLVYGKMNQKVYHDEWNGTAAEVFISASSEF